MQPGGNVAALGQFVAMLRRIPKTLTNALNLALNSSDADPIIVKSFADVLATFVGVA